MVRKLKIGFLVTLMVLSALLLMIPEKAEAGIIIQVSGKSEVINGLHVCVCPNDENQCDCAFHLPDLW